MVDFASLYDRIKNSQSGCWQQVALSRDEYLELYERLESAKAKIIRLENFIAAIDEGLGKV